MAAHDLRNPLTAIYGLLQLLRDEPEIPPKQHREFVSVMIEACEGMVPMIEDRLDLSAIEAGTLRLKITAVVLKP
jgi:signal transduction histidine kinase